MNTKNQWNLSWRKQEPAPNSARSLFKFDPAINPDLDPGWYYIFEDMLGLAPADLSPHPMGDDPIAVPGEISLTPEQLTFLQNTSGTDNVQTDDYNRIKYSYGKSLDENLQLRHGQISQVPDAVIHPRDKEEVRTIVEYCNEVGIPIIPIGGGSTVVLGTRADKGGIALVLRTHMNKVLSINEANQCATVQPGMLGPHYEAALNNAPSQFNTKRAYTCGHFPQSFELATVGGWILALGSGQASTYYGDAYDIVLSQEYVTPTGSFKTHDIPGTATGPKVNDIMKGSEGAYGVLVEVTLKIFRYMPENRQYFSFMYPHWHAATEASREIAQGEFGLPAVYRISDGEETEVGLRVKGYAGGGIDKYLKFRGMEPGKRCICLGTVEGERNYTRQVKKQIKKVVSQYGGISLGESPTRHWEEGRYADIHIRDNLLDYGIILDTLETGVNWDKVESLHSAVRAFVKQRPNTVCMTHASHFYTQGTNLYFIFMMKPDNPDEYFEFRSGVVSKIVEHGGSVSHHHGVGRMLAPWLRTFLGTEQTAVLETLKQHFDPNGIMNPGNFLKD